MSSTTKPTILLIPGAWHPPTAFDPLTTYLTSHSYPVHPLALPSVNASPPLDSIDPDITFIRDTLNTLADSGADIIVLVHSYSGIPGASACKGLLKSDRSAEGLPGGVVHFVYCCAFAVPAGVSLMDCLGGQNLPWFVMSEDNKTVMPQTPRETFYNDITDEKTLEVLVGSLKPHSYATFGGKAEYAVYEDLGCTYVVCTEDAAIPVEVQRGMVQRAQKAVEEGGGGKKGGVVVRELKASHSPMVSVPEELGRVVRGCAGEEGV